LALVHQPFIAAEFRRFIHGDNPNLTRLERRCGAGAFALRLYFLFKSGHIEFQVSLQGDVAREIDRKSVGVIEFENSAAGNGIAPEDRKSTRLNSSHITI